VPASLNDKVVMCLPATMGSTNFSRCSTVAFAAITEAPTECMPKQIAVDAHSRPNISQTRVKARRPCPPGLSPYEPVMMMHDRDMFAAVCTKTSTVVENIEKYSINHSS